VALPALNLVRCRFPEATLSLLTNKPIASKAAPMESVLGPNFFSEVIDYPIGLRDPRKLLAVSRRIRSGGFDLLVNLSAARGRFKAWRDYCFFRVSGVSRVIGTPTQSRDFAVVEDADTGLYESETLRLLRRVVSLGSADLKDPSAWDLRLTVEERAKARSILPEYSKPSIAACFGTKMQAKDWGQANWADLVSRMGEAFPNWRLVVVGSGDESERAVACTMGWRGPVVNLCGELSPRESAAVLEKCALFIGHDSGPMHLASAVGTACVAIFAARSLPGQWFPARGTHKIIYHKTDCFGCELEECITEQKRCIRSISVNEVFDAVRSSLN
jgi:heptosyltransferase-3